MIYDFRIFIKKSQIQKIKGFFFFSNHQKNQCSIATSTNLTTRGFLVGLLTWHLSTKGLMISGYIGVDFSFHMPGLFIFIFVWAFLESWIPTPSTRLGMDKRKTVAKSWTMLQPRSYIVWDWFDQMTRSMWSLCKGNTHKVDHPLPIPTLHTIIILEVEYSPIFISHLCIFIVDL